MKKNKRNEKGFTMVELIIVVAIMGIIGALLVPSFGNMAAKSKVSTDITTVKTIKRLIDAYNVENPTSQVLSTDNAAAIGLKLFNAGYLESNTIKLQTKGELKYTPAVLTGTTPTASMLQLDLTVTAVTDANVKAVGDKMITSEKATYEEWLIAK